MKHYIYGMYIFLTICLIAIVLMGTLHNQNNATDVGKFSIVKRLPIVGERRNRSNDPASPWQHVPHFEIYIRMSSSDRFMYEYTNWFLKGYKMNYPPERWQNTIVLGLDDESQNDHEAGRNLSSVWPYPRIYYHKAPLDKAMYRNFQRYRGYWDQLFPERYIKSRYVGYCDTDTIFSTTVTPNSLFVGGKPVVIGMIDKTISTLWPQATRYLLGHKEVAQFMSYFPVIIKVQHVIELRKFLEKRFGKPFNSIFADVFNLGFESLCQFSVMCNYVWYYHRDEYVFHFLTSSAGPYPIVQGRETYERLQEVNKNHPERFFPKPRISVHGHYLNDRNMIFLSGDRASCEAGIRSALREAFCYIVGFDNLPECCKAYDRTVLNFHLYQFEWWTWAWHPKALQEQNRYLNEAREIVQYQRRKGLPLFGVNAKDFVCPS